MTDLSPDATHDISSALTTLLADVFALYAPKAFLDAKS